MVDRGVMVVRRSVTHLLIHKLHLEACYMMSPALRNHLPEFPYQLSTKKLNLLCDFGFSWSTVCLPSWDYTGQSHLRVGWWYLLCALAALHAFSSQPLHCCTVYVYTSPLPEVAQSCPTLCGPMDCSPPGSSIHGFLHGKSTGVGCHFLLQGIFPTQGSNPSLPHCRQTLYRLSHQGSNLKCYKTVKSGQTRGGWDA